jgi:hypothetical protein
MKLASHCPAQMRPEFETVMAGLSEWYETVGVETPTLLPAKA